MTQKLKSRVESYIAKTRSVLKKIKLKKPFQSMNDDLINEFMDHVRRYVEDAKFYFESGDLETALASISYCEGLLDALKLLGIAEFEWPSGRNAKGE